MPTMLSAIENCPTEWGFTSAKRYDDPYNEIEVDVIVESSDGPPWRLPAYWSGGQEWRVRFAAPRAGAYRWRSVCTDARDNGLHDVSGTLCVTGYAGSNELLRRGPVRVASDHRHFEHADGTPFLWLADTWWMGLCKRLSWPDEFQMIARDRRDKGFNVIQIIAGPYPDMTAFDPRGASEAGFPWEKDFSRINPAYYDNADVRVAWLVRSGFVPCIVGCWGYYLPQMGIEKIKRHWRNLIARWGSYPVVWCLAGEATMAFYLSKDPQADSAKQKREWTELARYVRKIDPYHRPITIHPTNIGRDQVEDDSVLDFDMLQTGHGGIGDLPGTASAVKREVARTPAMPVINGEVCYEGILEGSREEVQRAMFWTCTLSGAAGHTYGANGIWQLNGATQPYGPSPHGTSWGDRTWEEAMRLPGSAHVGIGRRILERFQWWRFKPHPEWLDPHAAEGNWLNGYAAGISGETRVIYFPAATNITPWGKRPAICRIEKGINYRAHLIDPKTGAERLSCSVEADADGKWEVPLVPVMQDWVLALMANG